MCVYKIAKFLLFAFNFCFWLAGAAILGVAIWILVDDDLAEVVDVAGVSIYTGSYVLIVAGLVMLIVGFAGCCGALKESTCLLGLYFVCLFGVFALEVGIGIWGYIEYGSLEEAIENTITEGYPDITASEQFQTIQQNFHCCGTNTTCEGFPGGEQVGCECAESGFSCSKTPKEKSCTSEHSVGSSYDTPCTVAITDFIESNMSLVAGIALGIGIAEILGMIISMCLCCKIKEKGHHA